MESRQSRASARYGPGPSAASASVFNGPVRKWKKQWVSSPSPSKNKNDTASPPPLILHRWTPLSATSDDEPRKRRCRYAPVVPIERGHNNMEGREKVISSIEEAAARKSSTVNQSKSIGSAAEDLRRSEIDRMFENPPSTGNLSPEEEVEEEDEESGSE